MSSAFYIGLAVGFIPWFLLLLVFRLVKTPKDAGPSPTSLLAERNEIGQAQTMALADIACMVTKLAQFEALKMARHKEERRERIAMAAMAVIPHVGCGADLLHDDFAVATLQFADPLIAALDRKETSEDG